MKAYLLSDGEFDTAAFRRLDALVKDCLTRRGYEIAEKRLEMEELGYCRGCFGCWVKKPGECVIKDGMAEINRRTIASDAVIYLAPVVFGQYSANMKNAVDRWIPNILPFFKVRRDGSTAHPARYRENPRYVMIGYGDGLMPEDRALFQNITKKHRENGTVLFFEGRRRSAEGGADVRGSAESGGNSMSERKRIAILSGSPKAPGTAASDLLAEIAAESLRGEDADVQILNVRDCFTKKNTAEAYIAMAEAEALIIVFPLYVFCLPGILMRFLQDYWKYASALPGGTKSALVYAVVNCGFPEPEINEHAALVIGRFAAAVGARFRFGVLIGGGGMLSYNAPQIKKMLALYGDAVSRIKAEIGGSLRQPENVPISASVPRWLYFGMGNLGWRIQGRKNHIRRSGLYARPYQPE